MATRQIIFKGRQLEVPADWFAPSGGIAEERKNDVRKLANEQLSGELGYWGGRFAPRIERGFGNVAGAPVDLAAMATMGYDWATNYITNPGEPMPEKDYDWRGGSKSVHAFMRDKWGRNVDPAPAETRMGRIADAAIEEIPFGVAGGVGMGGIKLAAWALGKKAPSLAAALAMETTGAVGAGAGGQAGLEIAGDYPVVGNLVGSVAGAYTPFGVAGAARKVAGSSLTGRAVGGAKKIMNKPGQMKDDLANVLTSAGRTETSNLERAIALRDQIGGGYNPTTAQATGDPALLALQNKLETEATGDIRSMMDERRAKGETAVANYAAQAAPEGDFGRFKDTLSAGAKQQLETAGRNSVQAFSGRQGLLYAFADDVPFITKADLGDNIIETSPAYAAGLGRKTPEGVVDSLFGRNTLSVLRDFLKNGGPQARRQAQNAAFVSFFENASDAKGVVIVPERAHAWVKQHFAKIDAIGGETAEKIEKLIDDNDLLVSEAAKWDATQKELLKAPIQSRLAKYERTGRIDELLGAILSEPEYAKSIVDIIKESPGAMAGLQTQVWNRLYDASANGETGLAMLREYEPILKEIMEPKHLSDLETIYEAKAVLERSPRPGMQSVPGTPGKGLGADFLRFQTQRRQVRGGQTSGTYVLTENITRMLTRAWDKIMQETNKEAIFDQDIANLFARATKGDDDAAKKIESWYRTGRGLVRSAPHAWKFGVGVQHEQHEKPPRTPWTPPNVGQDNSAANPFDNLQREMQRRERQRAGTQ